MDIVIWSFETLSSFFQLAQHLTAPGYFLLLNYKIIFLS